MSRNGSIYLEPNKKLRISINLTEERIKSLKLKLEKEKEFSKGNLIVSIKDEKKELDKKRISLYRIENDKQINIDIKDVSILECNKKINIELFVDNIDGVYIVKYDNNQLIQIEKESIDPKVLKEINDYKSKVDEIKQSKGWKIVKLVNNIFKEKDNKIDLPIQREKSEYEKWITNKYDSIEKLNNKIFRCTLITVVEKIDRKEFCRFLDSIKLQKSIDKKLIVVADEKLKLYVRNIVDLYRKDFSIKIVIKENKSDLCDVIDKIEDEYIAFIDNKCILSENAFLQIRNEITDNVECAYFDEDIIDIYNGEIKKPKFKPDFSIDMLRSINYIGKLFIIKNNVLKKVNKLSVKYFIYDNYDLYLKLYEEGYSFTHISKVLFHVSEESNSNINNGKIILEEHLARIDLKATVSMCKNQFFRITYNIDLEKVSIIIPNKDSLEILRSCIDSILNKTTYDNYEIIIVENNSVNEETFEYYNSIKDIEKVNIITYEGEFNYSAINNFAVKQSKGEYIIFLNNDIEIITPNWIENMIQYAQREDVGIVGAKLYYIDDTIQHAGVIIGMRGLAAHRYCGLYKSEEDNVEILQYVQNLSAVTAAAMMVKRKVYDEVNGLDEKLKVAFNDIDFCMAVIKKGYLIVWNPFVEMYHYESISRGKEDTEEKVLRFESEIERFYSKWKLNLIEGDPYFNKNLSLKDIDYSIAMIPEDRDVLIKKYL